MSKANTRPGRIPLREIGKGRTAPKPQDLFNKIVGETLDRKLAGDLDEAERRQLEDYKLQITNAVEPLISHLKIDCFDDPVMNENWVGVILQTCAFLGGLGGLKKKT